MKIHDETSFHHNIEDDEKTETASLKWNRRMSVDENIFWFFALGCWCVGVVACLCFDLWVMVVVVVVSSYTSIPTEGVGKDIVYIV